MKGLILEGIERVEIILVVGLEFGLIEDSENETRSGK